MSDWVNCLVLPVAPLPYRETVVEAIRRAETMIFADPVLVDLARVAATDSPDPLGGDLDETALVLHRELVTWARSPARNPAPRCVFCVLLLHPDRQEADRLVRMLADTGVLSELPIVFQVGELAPPLDGGDDPDEVVRAILGAAIVAAQEVEETPDFCLTVDRLATLVPGRPSRQRAQELPPRERAVPIVRTPPSAAGESTNQPPATDDEADRRAGDDRAGRPAARGDGEVGDAGRSRRRWPGGTAARRLAGSALSLLARRSVPASGIDVIRDLSSRTDRMSMLYVVLASEPVRPSRESRAARLDTALVLARTLTSDAGPDREPWYVRAFTADGELRAGTPLPASDLLRHRDFPERWGVHFDLYDSVGDIIENIERDTSSFLRRGLERQRMVVVFLAGGAPGGGADAVRRLDDLCAVAETIWVLFGNGSPPTEGFASVGVRFLEHHEDLADELLEVVTGHSGSTPY